MCLKKRLKLKINYDTKVIVNRLKFSRYISFLVRLFCRVFFIFLRLFSGKVFQNIFSRNVFSKQCFSKKHLESFWNSIFIKLFFIESKSNFGFLKNCFSKNNFSKDVFAFVVFQINLVFTLISKNEFF